MKTSYRFIKKIPGQTVRRAWEFVKIPTPASCSLVQSAQFHNSNSFAQLAVLSETNRYVSRDICQYSEDIVASTDPINREGM